MTRLSDKQRDGAVKHAQFLIDHAGSIGYLYGGGLDWIDHSMVDMEKLFVQGANWEPDCRATVLWIAKWSNWSSPTGDGWAGSSGDMWKHLPHTSVKNAKPGGLVTFGSEGQDHVCMVMQADGTDPWVFSHGSPPGPLHIRLSDESAAHAGQPVTFLDVSQLG